jgi:hypothetical protein
MTRSAGEHSDPSDRGSGRGRTTESECLRVDSEDGVIHGDPRRLARRRVPAYAAEGLADLPLPAAQVGSKDRLLVDVGDLGRAGVFSITTVHEIALAGGAEVANPFRVRARRDEKAVAVEAAG